MRRRNFRVASIFAFQKIACRHTIRLECVSDEDRTLLFAIRRRVRFRRSLKLQWLSWLDDYRALLHLAPTFQTYYKAAYVRGEFEAMSVIRGVCAEIGTEQ